MHTETRTTTETDYREVREQLIKTYKSELDQISKQLTTNREQKEKKKENPLITVVVSLYEQFPDNLTGKMFFHTLNDLIRQAKEANFNLDIVIVINNGGGANGDQLTFLVEKACREIDNAEFQTLQILPPEDNKNEYNPLNSPLPFGRERQQPFRIAILKQNKDKRNQGKVAALQFFAVAMKNLINNGYAAPKAVLQIDAETVLTGNSNPLTALYEKLMNDDDLVGVGTKDKFVRIDPKTGEATDLPIPSGQIEYMRRNKDRFITLPGGAMLINLENYLAGILSIATYTPQVITEDYLITQIFRHTHGPNSVMSVPGIKHNNRCGIGEQAIKQLKTWYHQSIAIHKIFPQDRDNIVEMKMPPFGIMLIRSLARRTRNTFSGKFLSNLKVGLLDILLLPNQWETFHPRKTPDIIGNRPKN